MNGRGGGRGGGHHGRGQAHNNNSGNNSRSSSSYGQHMVPLMGGGGSSRGRNFSGDSNDIYPFHLDGLPSYGEVVPEPAFVTPLIGGMTYFYDNQFVPATGMAENVLKSNIKAQM
jgi:hypothetical protein